MSHEPKTELSHELYIKRNQVISHGVSVQLKDTNILGAIMCVTATLRVTTSFVLVSFVGLFLINIRLLYMCLFCKCVQLKDTNILGAAAIVTLRKMHILCRPLCDIYISLLH